MAQLYDLARMTVSGTPGLGIITLGSAVAPFLTFSAAGIAGGDVVSYAATDTGNSVCEAGRGTYLSSNGTLTRTTILMGSGGVGTAVNLSSATQVAITAIREDIYNGSALCGRFAFVNTTQVSFAAYNGDQVKINGTFFQIPAAGLTAQTTNCFLNGSSNSTLSSSTNYFAYIFNNSSGGLTIDFSSVVHVTNAVTGSGNVGVEQKSGDATRSLVGMAYVSSVSLFSDITTLSWFNRKGKSGNSALSANVTSSAGAAVEISSTIRQPFNCWSDETVTVTINAITFPASNVGNDVRTQISFDGGAVEDAMALGQAPGTTQPAVPSCVTIMKNGLSEGNHYATMFGFTNQQFATWIGAASVGGARTTLWVGTRG